MSKERGGTVVVSAWFIALVDGYLLQREHGGCKIKRSCEWFSPLPPHWLGSFSLWSVFTARWLELHDISFQHQPHNVRTCNSHIAGHAKSNKANELKHVIQQLFLVLAAKRKTCQVLILHDSYTRKLRLILNHLEQFKGSCLDGVCSVCRVLSWRGALAVCQATCPPLISSTSSHCWLKVKKLMSRGWSVP